MFAKRVFGAAALLVSMMVLLPIGQAWADVIDGDWCSAQGRYMSIKGPDIVTPAGTKTTGNYSRHSFSYTIPSNEPNAGQVVSMILVNEETVHLWIGSPPAGASQPPPQVWHRCNPVTSDLGPPSSEASRRRS